MCHMEPEILEHIVSRFTVLAAQLCLEISKHYGVKVEADHWFHHEPASCDLKHSNKLRYRKLFQFKVETYSALKLLADRPKTFILRAVHSNQHLLSGTKLA